MEGEESCSSREEHALVPVFPFKKWKNKGGKWLSQAYFLILALNSGLPNTYLRSLLEEVGPKERGTQGRGGSSPGVAWKTILQIYVSRDTG